MTSLAHLHSLTNRILDAAPDAFGELFTVCDELYQFLTAITSTDTDEAGNREQLMLSSGKAIGLTWAGMCIKDVMRTKKFMDGVYQAVIDASAKRKDRPVHLLYAGTGPFATLVLPLTARFSPTEIQFTLLEINQPSLDCLQKLIDLLGLQSYIRKIEKADATVWAIDPEEPIDIFLSETMNQALITEPQVAIFMNMIPQLPANTIIIPEKISLEAALIDTAKQMNYKMGNTSIDDSAYPLGPVFELNRETALAYTAAFKKSGNVYQFPPRSVAVPKGKTGSELSILTTVTIYSSGQLRAGDSALTLPLKLTTIQDPGPAVFHLWYHTGENPGVRMEKR